MNACYDKVPVIIPALNPDNRIRIFIHSLEEAGFSHIIVVDDASSDGSASFVKANYPSVRLVALNTNGG